MFFVYIDHMFGKKGFIVLIFTVSAIGLAIVQFQYLKIGLGLAQSQFSKKIVDTRDGIAKELSEYNSLTYTLGTMIRQDGSNLKISMDSLERVSQFYLNDYISYRLNLSGIDAQFSYRLYSREQSREYLSSDTVDWQSTDLRKYPIEMKGYLANLLDDDLVLELGFEDLNSYFLKQLNGLTIPSFVFLIAIIGTVLWVLHSFYGQTRLITTTNEFINNLTHELKTPVFSIGLATKILEGEVAKERQPMVNMIRQETDRLKNHIEKVLELASLESGKNITVFKEMDFRHHLESICHEFKILGEYGEVDFSFQMQKGSYHIKADIFHLKNAIGNLLENAVKYAERPVVRLSAEIHKKRLHIAISDNGQGIPKEDERRIFKKYHRGSQGGLHRRKGYGLGLPYAKRIVRLHRGRITLSSVPGKGSVFTIILPMLKK